MEPDVGLGIGRDGAGDTPARPRPSLHVRLMEIIGLVLVIYGLGSNGFGLAAVGGAMIAGSYVIYRRKHGPFQRDKPDSGPGGMDSDGSGD